MTPQIRVHLIVFPWVENEQCPVWEEESTGVCLRLNLYPQALRWNLVDSVRIQRKYFPDGLYLPDWLYGHMGNSSSHVSKDSKSGVRDWGKTDKRHRQKSLRRVPVRDRDRVVRVSWQQSRKQGRKGCGSNFWRWHKVETSKSVLSSLLAAGLDSFPLQGTLKSSLRTLKSILQENGIIQSFKS